MFRFFYHFYIISLEFKSYLTGGIKRGDMPWRILTTARSKKTEENKNWKRKKTEEEGQKKTEEGGRPLHFTKLLKFKRSRILKKI